MNNRLKYCHCRAFYFKECIEPKMMPLQQLAEGFDFKNMLQVVRKNPGLFSKLLTIGNSDITLDGLLELLAVQFSEKGSNRYLY